MSDINLSIVIPLFNEEENVEALLDAVSNAADEIDCCYEIVVVDDGSSDGTWQALEFAATNYPALKAFRFSRNFGHQKALLAGLSFAEGEAILSMDGDLQHPPALIPALYEKWQEGFDVVATRRHDQQVSSLFKRVTSRSFYRLFSWLAGIPMRSGSSDFRLIDARVRNELLRFQDVDLFIRGAVEWLGFKTHVLDFEAGARHAGTTKFNLKRMAKFASNAIVSFSVKPLRLSIWLGFVTSLAAFSELGYILWAYSQGLTVPGWASILGVLSLLFGILFILLGIIGAYITRLHIGAQARPPYVVSERLEAKAIPLRKSAE